jgi:hypothetical protein
MNAVVNTLAEALQSAPSLPWRDALYLPVETPWELSTPAIISNPDDLYDETTNTEAVPATGMRYALSITDVQDIVDNARKQRPDCSLVDLLKAFTFYFERDAFIELGE